MKAHCSPQKELEMKEEIGMRLWESLEGEGPEVVDVCIK